MNNIAIEADTFDFIERLNLAASIADVHKLLAQELGKYGFTQFIMLDMPPPKQRFDDFMILNGCMEDWYAHYSQENLHLYDPIARRMRASVEPFYWDEVIVDRNDRREQRMMHDLSAFGMQEGLSVPMFGTDGRQSCLAMGGPSIDRHPRARSALHVISIFAYARTRTLRSHEAKPALQNERRHLLTAREREVLKWVACGKTDWEIGEILDISRETSFAHVRNCCRKLDALTRPQAVAKAMMSGEISLDG